MIKEFSGMLLLVRPSTALKDVLRGFRFLLLEVRRPICGSFNKLSKFIAPPIAKILLRLEKLEIAVMRFLGLSAHRLLDKSSKGKNDICMFLDVPDEPGADVLFAQAAYKYLTLTLARLGVSDVLVSETIAVIAYHRAMDNVDRDGAKIARAAALFGEIIDAKVIGAPPGVRLTAGDGDNGLVQTAIFAWLLWALVERETDAENELELLAICSDAALTLRSEILDAADTPEELIVLFESSVEAI